MTVNRIYRGLTTLIANTLAPPRCVFCATSLQAGECCDRCLALLPTNETACARCANPLQKELPEGVDCAACQATNPPYHRAIAPFLFEFPVDSAIRAVKFGHKMFYLPFFGGALADALHESELHVDCLVPVPLHWRRHAERGFNQAYELSKALARQTGLPLFTDVKRIRKTATQSGLNAHERRRNLRGAFRVSKPLRHAKLLVVDDVMTTGNTCRALAESLQRAGADSVAVLTIARA